MKEDWTTFRLYVPPGTEQAGDAMHHLMMQLWARTCRGWWSRMVDGQPRLAFEVRAAGGRVDHNWAVPRALAAFVRQELAEAYRPGEPVPVDAATESMTEFSAGATLRLARPACFGLADRPIGQQLVTALQDLQPSETVLLQFMLSALQDGEWRPEAHRAFREASQHGEGQGPIFDAVNGAISSLFDQVNGAAGTQRSSPMRQARADAVERAALREAPAKLQDHGFKVVGRVLTAAPTQARAVSLVHTVTSQFAVLDGANQVGAHRAWRPRRLWDLALKREPAGTGSVWTCRELAMVVGVPGPRQEDGARVLELREMPPAGEVTIGYGLYRGQRVPVQITTQALCQHLAIMGKTGAGKGVLQLGLYMEMARAGHGFTTLWPLRADAYRLMAALPEERLQDVIFFEVGHPRHALPLNLLAHDGTEEDQARVERDAMGLAWRLWSDSWGKAMERYLRAAIIGAAALQGHLGTAERILTDEATRAKAAARVGSESVRRFLQGWEASPAAVDPAVNKLQELLWQPPVAAMVAQPGALPWRDVILGRKIIIGSLNQELMGDLPAMLAASGIVSQLQRAAMSIPPEERIFHALGLDEFRTVAGRARDNWEVGFSQLRQFKVGLIPAGQYPAQLPEAVWRSLSGNVGNKVILREEAEHARTCLELLGPGVTAEDLAALPGLQGYASLLLDGRPVGPFTLYAPDFLKPVRDGYQAAEESMARWLRPRQGSKQTTGPKALEVD